MTMVPGTSVLLFREGYKELKPMTTVPGTSVMKNNGGNVTAYQYQCHRVAYGENQADDSGGYLDCFSGYHFSQRGLLSGFRDSLFRGRKVL